MMGGPLGKDLTEAAENALGHVDVVACGASAAIRARLRLNGDGLGCLWI